jgi:hypothetical protein
MKAECARPICAWALIKPNVESRINTTPLIIVQRTAVVVRKDRYVIKPCVFLSDLVAHLAVVLDDENAASPAPA